MDNKKIGKLIADLRKKQGLTQQDLGDKVGVGFRAVSKWERGLTLPDISIINELSKILGITSDELLTGKINRENKSKEKRKISSKIKITITIMVSIIIVLSSVFIYFNNKTYVYNIYSVNQDEYYVEGQVSFYKNKISIIVNKIEFKYLEQKSLKVKNYEYDIISGDSFIFRYGYIYDVNEIDRVMDLNDLAKNININYNAKTKKERTEFLKDSIIIILRFTTEEDKEVIKNIEIKLELKEND